VSTIPKQMQTTLDHIVKTALARPSLSEVSKDELLMLTQEFPYAPVLQFLYTKRLQESGDSRFGNSVTRTALFFNNPHWLHQQLRAAGREEKIKELELAISGVDESREPSATTISIENPEYEEYTQPISSVSEAALIASITEAPDGTIPEAANAVHLETLENESEGPQHLELIIPEGIDSTEAEDAEDPIFETFTPVAAEQPEGILVEETSNALDLEDDAIDTYTFTEPAAPEPDELTTSTEAVEYIEGSKIVEETDQDLSIGSELLSVDSTEFNEMAATSETGVEPDADLLSDQDIPTDAEYLESAAAEIAISTPEISQEADHFPEMDLVIGTESTTEAGILPEMEDAPPSLAEVMEEQADLEAATETSAAQDKPGRSLITVIAPVQQAFVNTIHTINLASETDNDDDLGEATITAETLRDNSSILPQTGFFEDGKAETEEGLEADNDDDAAILRDLETETADDCQVATDISIETDNIEPSGLENMGFLPEELLKDADEDPLASQQDAEPEPFASASSGSTDDHGVHLTDDSPVFLDDDHPDATDPRDSDHFDEQMSDIQPGDLIKMAGLDQHNETELSFEPLHLTDYFASVGVSLPPEEQAEVMGRPSKSFTGWIRSMKRIHPEKSVAQFTTSDSDQVRAEAEMSNEQEEVLTETMAGIYALQGLVNKAIDIYEKLSLLNPEKSAIFAAKISELKGRSS
jgi:hypothetical protein